MAIFEDITEQEKKRLELETMKQETLEKANQVINNQMFRSMTHIRHAHFLFGVTTNDSNRLFIIFPVSKIVWKR